MDILKILILLISFSSLTGCQFGYILKSAQGQLKIFHRKVSLEKALNDPNLSEKNKDKLRLAILAKKFAVEKIGLTKNNNYSEYVQLDEPYVVYAVNAAQAWELKNYIWDYPIVGKMPYKGFFTKADALAEENDLKQMGLDTHVRGVSAYSTLGWFDDPLLSSMLNYKDHDLVNTLIHESVHATLYIKNSADFNERMAVFVGNKATELFYLEREGENSKTLKEIKNFNTDELIFSKFISEELKELEDWYKVTDHKRNLDLKESRIKEIQNRFKEKLQPQLLSNTYKNFPELKLNNARLLLYKTYVSDLSDFEKLFTKVKGDFHLFLAECKKLESHPSPEKGLKDLISN